MALGLTALSVLVVDDNAQMRTIIGTILSGAGVGRVYFAENGKRAVEMMAVENIDIIYLDYEMPQMDGLRTLRTLRRGPEEIRYTPVIMVTGHSDLPRISTARDLGVNEFLGKPVTTKAILARLEAVIMNPRPYVDAEAFFGPDRRRRKAGEGGPRRRASDGVVNLDC